MENQVTVATLQQQPVKKISVRLILILGAMTAFASLSIDMYLPSFPTLEKDLHTNSSLVQFSLAAFFVGMALGQAFYGPLADRFGRKRPLYAGISLYVLASLGCALSPNIETLIAMRFVQAVGGCAGIVIARAMVRDLFDREASARVFSLLTLVLGVAPILAPILGGQVLKFSGWRAIFGILVVFGIACLMAAALGLRETLPEAARSQHTHPIRGALRVYGQLLVDRHFNGYAFAGGIAQAGLFAYISGSPFVFIKLYGVPEQAYGLFFGVNAVGFIGASQLNHRLLARWKSDAILSRAVMIVAGFGLLLLAMAVTGWGGMWGLLPPLFGFIASLGFSFPNAIAGGMAYQAERAGSASALLGTIQFGAATIAGSMVGALHAHSAVPMAAVMAACSVTALVLHRLLVSPMLRVETQADGNELDIQVVE
jgi:DHA1 family bicyclomycin/chloramphenicol resistance-like MFS transporter